MNARTNKHYHDNKERFSATAKARYQETKSTVLEKRRLYYIKNRDRIIAKARDHYHGNIASIAARRQIRYEACKDDVLAKCRVYYLNNSAKYKARARARVCILAERGSYTQDDVRFLEHAQGFKCACCKTSITDGYEIDHITPLAKGGDNTKHNIQLLCRRCNRRKHAKDPIAFMQSNGYLL